MDTKKAVTDQVLFQSAACTYLGSPLYGGLLERLAPELEHDTPAWRLLEPFAGWDPDTIYTLRLMGAVHRLVLTGEAPDLAPHYRPGGDAHAAWPSFAALLEERERDLAELARTRPVQTNEVGRSAVLAPAILYLARGRPVRLLELGASAGLNLRFDAYRYEDRWGDPASPVRLVDLYEGDPPPFAPESIEVRERRGCDARPVDPCTEDGRITLLSYVWPDQGERLELLRGALELAPTMPAQVDAAPADDWIEQELASPLPSGTTTVVFHSVFWRYLDESARERITAAIEDAGARATDDAPLAWLRMEADAELTRVDATLWPGGRSHLIARAGYHGRPVHWLVEGDREGAGDGS